MIDNAPIGAMLPIEIPEPLLPTPQGLARWVIQPKYDGHRVLVDLRGRDPRVCNRKGEDYGKPFPEEIVGHLHDHFTHVVDGEWLPQLGRYVIFDTIEPAGTQPWAARMKLLTYLDERLTCVSRDVIAITAGVNLSRRGFASQLISETKRDPNCDGVVYKRTDSLYTPFCRSTNWRKYKFAHELDAFVTRIGIDGKSNCELAVLDPVSGTEFALAKASTAGKPNLKIGDVVTVRFLKFTGESLREPRIVAIRDDKTIAECTVAQLVPFLPKNA